MHDPERLDRRARRQIDPLHNVFGSVLDHRRRGRRNPKVEHIAALRPRHADGGCDGGDALAHDLVPARGKRVGGGPRFLENGRKRAGKGAAERARAAPGRNGAHLGQPRLRGFFGLF